MMGLSYQGNCSVQIKKESCWKSGKMQTESKKQNSDTYSTRNEYISFSDIKVNQGTNNTFNQGDKRNGPFKYD